MVGSGLASGLRQLPTSTQLDRAPLLLVKLSSEAGRPQPTSTNFTRILVKLTLLPTPARPRSASAGQAELGSWSTPTDVQPTSPWPCQSDFASGHRATALRFCWSSGGRKRSGFHAVKASRRHFPTSDQRAASLRFCWSIGGVEAVRLPRCESLPEAFPTSDQRAASLRFCWSTGGWKRSGFRTQTTSDLNSA